VASARSATIAMPSANSVQPRPASRAWPARFVSRLEATAVIAEVPDRDPQPVAVRRRAQRVRVRLPPQARAQEAPLQELAAGDGKPVQPAALEHDRHGARARA